jgi:hypothetical protein
MSEKNQLLTMPTIIGKTFGALALYYPFIRLQVLHQTKNLVGSSLNTESLKGGFSRLNGVSGLYTGASFYSIFYGINYGINHLNLCKLRNN